VLSVRSDHFRAAFGFGDQQKKNDFNDERQHTLTLLENTVVVSAIIRFLYIKDNSAALEEETIVPALIAADRYVYILYKKKLI